MMLRTSLVDSDSDEEPAYERAYFVRVRTEPPQDNARAEISVQNISSMCTGKMGAINNTMINAERTKVNLKEIKYYDSPELNSGDYYVGAV